MNIAQVFQRSGTLQVSFKEAGITSPSDFAGKTIGNWGFGNEYEIFAALARTAWIPRTTSRWCSSSSTCSGCCRATSTRPRR